jgi:hypothetical protein
MEEAEKAFSEIDNILLVDEFLTHCRITTFYTNLDPLNIELPPYKDLEPLIVNSLMINITGLQMLLIQDIPKELTALLRTVAYTRKGRDPLRIMAVLGKADLRQLAGEKHIDSTKATEMLKAIEKFLMGCGNACRRCQPQLVYFGTGANDAKAPWYFLSSRLHKEIREPNREMSIICHDIDEGLRPHNYTPRASFVWNSNTIHDRMCALAAFVNERNPKINPVWKYCPGIGPQFRTLLRTSKTDNSLWEWQEKGKYPQKGFNQIKTKKGGRTTWKRAFHLHGPH